MTGDPLQQFTDLDFADDIALLAPTLRALQKTTSSLESEAAPIGLRISGEKSKIMRVGYATPSNTAVTVKQQQQLEEVDRFMYLGCTFSSDGDVEHDVKCRIGKAWAAFQRLRPIWMTTALPLSTKLRLLKTIVIPTALYAAETWKSTAKINRHLDVFQQRCLRRLLKITYRDRVTNEEVYRRAGVEPLHVQVTKRRFRFAGHILRLPDPRPARVAVLWNPKNGKRRRGRPKITWRRTFLEDLRSVELSWDEATTAAIDRVRWRSLVAQCADRRGRI